MSRRSSTCQSTACQWGARCIQPSHAARLACCHACCWFASILAVAASSAFDASVNAVEASRPAADPSSQHSLRRQHALGPPARDLSLSTCKHAVQGQHWLAVRGWHFSLSALTHGFAHNRPRRSRGSPGLRAHPGPAAPQPSLCRHGMRTSAL